MSGCRLDAEVVPRSTPQAAGPSCAARDLVLASQMWCGPSQPLIARSRGGGRKRAPNTQQAPGGERTFTYRRPLWLPSPVSLQCDSPPEAGLSSESRVWVLSLVCVYVMEAVVSTGQKV